MFTHFNNIDRTIAVIDQLRRHMDRVFDENTATRSYDSLRASSADEAERLWPQGRFPRLTLTNAATSLELKAEVPGLTEKDLQISILQEVLTLNGERKLEAPEGYYVHRQERAPFKFARSFTLPCKVDPEKSTATLKNGVLTIMLTKVLEAQPRQIAVKVQ